MPSTSPVTLSQRSGPISAKNPVTMPKIAATATMVAKNFASRNSLTGALLRPFFARYIPRTVALYSGHIRYAMMMPK